MGVTSSKPSGNEAILLCRERTRCIKQAIYSRYEFSAAHLAYVQSLRSIGSALRRLVEAEFSNEPSVPTLETERTPSRSSYASSSPLQLGENLGSPITRSPLPRRLSNVSYMRAADNAAVTCTMCPSAVNLVKEEEIDSSWDFFDAKHNGKSSSCHDCSKTGELVPSVANNMRRSCERKGEMKFGVDESLEVLIGMASGELRRSSRVKDEIEGEEFIAEREDASEFITHRAKDFLSSTKDIEHRFLRAAESGNEVSRLLETSKIRLTIATETIGKSFLMKYHTLFLHIRIIL